MRAVPTVRVIKSRPGGETLGRGAYGTLVREKSNLKIGFLPGSRR
jgi:hypothetical protein